MMTCFIQGGGAHSRNNPYSCVCLHGDRKPAERKDNLERFKKQEAKFLICTDVAARGLDITGLPFSKYSDVLRQLKLFNF
jgi:ATP-dependent RNA helicase DDX1